MIDLTSELGIRAAKRLNEEFVVWLTTVSPTATPQPNPVWFYWDGMALLIYSQPVARKVRNITGNSLVSVNFQADNEGEDVIVLTGNASLEKKPPKHDPRYIQKYRDHIPKIGLTPESFSKSYNVALTVSPDKLRGF